MTLDYGSCSVEVVYSEGTIIVHSLVGSGNVTDLLTLFKSIRETARETPVFLSIDIDNPRMDQLMRTYQRFGAVPKAIVLEVK